MGSCSDTDIGPYCPDTNIGPSLEQYQYLGNTDIGPNPFLNVFAFESTLRHPSEGGHLG